jgi:hypothetical protein
MNDVFEGIFEESGCVLTYVRLGWRNYGIPLTFSVRRIVVPTEIQPSTSGEKV